MSHHRTVRTIGLMATYIGGWYHGLFQEGMAQVLETHAPAAVRAQITDPYGPEPGAARQ